MKHPLKKGTYYDLQRLIILSTEVLAKVYIPGMELAQRNDEQVMPVKMTHGGNDTEHEAHLSA